MKSNENAIKQWGTDKNDLSIFEQFGQRSDRKKVVLKSDKDAVALTYTRVSSKEQFLTNGSIETQKAMVIKLSVSMKVPIVENFGGNYESAQSEERKEFQRMMTYISQSKQNIKYIFVSDHDRFSRSGGHAIQLANLLR